MGHRLAEEVLEILWLDHGQLDVSVAGAKANALSILMAHDVDIPAGFVVPVQAFVAWENSGRLAATMRNSISKAYAELIERTDAAEVAVRSSAVDEDSPTSSFAGQYVTHLHIAGQEAVTRSIVDCWRSYRSTRIENYRAARGLHAAGGMAVIVQEMVMPRAAGVMFTRHPISHQPLYVIEATAGTGRSIVEGAEIPERVVIDPVTMRILEHKAPRSPSILSGDDIDQLVQCGHNLERICRVSLDIEWLIGRGVQILQARPITI